MLTKIDLVAIEKLLKPIRDSIDELKSDMYDINSDVRSEYMDGRIAESKLGAIQYDLDKIKKKLGI